MTLSQYIDSIKDRSIAVIGLGVSNKPLIRLLLTYGCKVTVCDKRSVQELGEDAFEMISAGAVLRTGEGYLDNLSQDIIFRTPGLMPFAPELASAKERGSVITSEMEVFFSVCPCRTIAITGSDGKTTTSTIISELLNAAGYTVHLGGNIGHPLLCDVPYFGKDDIAVLELSSFQLHSMLCSPDTAVITNVSPNHLDKHKGYGDYIDSKKNIFRNMKPEGILVLNSEDSLSEEIRREAPCSIKLFSMEDSSADVFFSKGKIFRNNAPFCDEIIDASEIRLPGKHNIQNYMTAFAVTEGLVSNEICAEVARSFSGVEHRLETVKEINGVTFINDSIGTSPTRTIAGLDSMKTKPVLIAGGYDKGIPFEELGDAICRKAKSLVLCGNTANKIRKAVEESAYYDAGFMIYETDDFKDAVLKAYSMASAGDIVLLSPACAAFDKFHNFAHRGQYFKDLVLELYNNENK